MRPNEPVLLGGALRDIPKTAAKETSLHSAFEKTEMLCLLHRVVVYLKFILSCSSLEFC